MEPSFLRKKELHRRIFDRLKFLKTIGGSNKTLRNKLASTEETIRVHKYSNSHRNLTSILPKKFEPAISIPATSIDYVNPTEEMIRRWFKIIKKQLPMIDLIDISAESFQLNANKR